MLLTAAGLLFLSATGNLFFLAFPALGVVIAFFFSAVSLSDRFSPNVLFALIGVSILTLVVASSLYNSMLDPRLLPTVIFLIQTAIFLPQVCCNMQKGDLSSGFRFLFVLIAVSMIVFAMFWKIAGLATSFRFGDPLAPGVFGFYMVIAAIASLGFPRARYLFPVFALFSILSESRAALLILFVSYILTTGVTLRKVFWAAIILGAGAIALSVAVQNGWEPSFLRERDDISSGRFFIWSVVWSGIQERPWLGHGEPPAVFGLLAADPSRSYGAHNSFLDISYENGVITGVMCYVMFFVIWVMAIRNSSNSLEEKRYINALGVALVVRSMVTSTFWINIADATSLFVYVTFCLFLARSPSVRGKHFMRGMPSNGSKDWAFTKRMPSVGLSSSRR